MSSSLILFTYLSVPTFLIHIISFLSSLLFSLYFTLVDRNRWSSSHSVRHSFMLDACLRSRLGVGRMLCFFVRHWAGWQADRQEARLVGRQSGRHAGWQAGIQSLGQSVSPTHERTHAVFPQTFTHSRTLFGMK